MSTTRIDLDASYFRHVQYLLPLKGSKSLARMAYEPGETHMQCLKGQSCHKLLEPCPGALQVRSWPRLGSCGGKVFALGPVI